MKRFRFPLRSVAILRSHKEAVARDRLAAAIRMCAAVEVRLDEARMRLLQMEQLRSVERSGRFRPADEISFFHAYRRECATEAEVTKQLAAAVTEVDAQRGACVEANRAVKAIERLEESSFEAYRAGAFRSEQAESDELAGRRVGRRMPISP